MDNATMCPPADPENPNQRRVLTYAARSTALPLDWNSIPRGIGTIILGLALSCTTVVLYLVWTARAIEGFQKAEGQQSLWQSPQWHSYLKRVEGTEAVPVGIMLVVAVLSTMDVWIRGHSRWMVVANILLQLAAVVFLGVLGELQQMDMGLLP